MSRIREAAAIAGRPAAQITLLAVSKSQPWQAIETAYRAGCRQFGENYLQEALEKIHALSHLTDIQWHFIGPLQSNKARKVAEYFDWVHSIDRLKVASHLNSHRPGELKPLNLCIQVNIDGEASKSGVSPEQLFDLAPAVAELPRVRLRGLMTIPKASRTLEEQRKSFHRLYQLFDRLRQQYPSIDTLSMGMSQDFEAAILENATIVRIGTDIFGARKHTPTQ